MTIDPKQPALGPVNIGHGIDHGAETDLGRDGDRQQRAIVRSTWSSGDIEGTDLERRVLAHERILQVLIAHMAETEPKFVAQLNAVFGEALPASRREYDFTDTDAYADQFVRKVVQLVEHHGQRSKVREPAPHPNDLSQADAPSAGVSVVTQLEVKRHAGIWEIIRDGQFYGHYDEDQPAFDAAEAVAVAVVASGGSADLVWTDGRPKSGISDRAEILRIIEFRPGSTTIVRQHLRGAHDLRGAQDLRGAS